VAAAATWLDIARYSNAGGISQRYTPGGGSLSTPVDVAGIREEGGQSLQHAICEQAEKYDARQLELELKALPRLSIRGKTMPDPRFAAWMEHDKISRTFAYDYPHGLYQPSNDVFAEMFAEHFGICSPVAERIGVGAPLQSARNDLRNPPTVDKWGFALSLRPQLPGGRLAGARSTTRVLPSSSRT